MIAEIQRTPGLVQVTTGGCTLYGVIEKSIGYGSRSRRLKLGRTPPDAPAHFVYANNSKEEALQVFRAQILL